MKSSLEEKFFSLEDIAKELNLSKGAITMWSSIFNQIKPVGTVNNEDAYSYRELVKFKEINEIKNAMNCSIQMVKKIIDKKGFFAEEPSSDQEEEGGEMARLKRREEQQSFELLRHALSGGIILKEAKKTKKINTKENAQEEIHPDVRTIQKTDNGKNEDVFETKDKESFTSEAPLKTKDARIAKKEVKKNGLEGFGSELDKILASFINPAKISEEENEKQEEEKGESENIPGKSANLKQEDFDRIMILLRKIENAVSDLD